MRTLWNKEKQRAPQNASDGFESTLTVPVLNYQHLPHAYKLSAMQGVLVWWRLRGFRERLPERLREQRPHPSDRSRTNAAAGPGQPQPAAQ